MEVVVELDVGVGAGRRRRRRRRPRRHRRRRRRRLVFDDGAGAGVGVVFAAHHRHGGRRFGRFTAHLQHQRLSFVLCSFFVWKHVQSRSRLVNRRSDDESKQRSGTHETIELFRLGFLS